MLCGIKDLAHTSAKPGKTQLINHFLINNRWYLVDLPGYGYAKTSKENKQLFESFISEYLATRKNLLCVFVLVDIRLPLQQIDREFFEWCAEKEIAFVIVFTKADKLGKNELNQNLINYKNELLKRWTEVPRHFITSADKKTGRDEILDFVEETNKVFRII